MSKCVGRQSFFGDDFYDECVIRRADEVGGLGSLMNACVVRVVSGWVERGDAH